MKALVYHSMACVVARFSTPMPAPEDPNKLTQADLKVAAAAGAQAAASKSMEVANDLQNEAEKAIEIEHPKEGTFNRLRDLAHKATEEVINLLKEANTPKS